MGTYVFGAALSIALVNSLSPSRAGRRDIGPPRRRALRPRRAISAFATPTHASTMICCAKHDPVGFPQRSCAFLHRDSNALSEPQWGAGMPAIAAPNVDAHRLVGQRQRSARASFVGQVRSCAITNDAGSRSEHELRTDGTSEAARVDPEAGR